MFQFNIYPTGTVENYRVYVNNFMGVSAIIDRQTGINENSMSGVAFYIANISNYINNHNVGTSEYPIISGYFNDIGYNLYTKDKYIFETTDDGIISGINNINAIDITLTSSGLFLNKAECISGFIYDCDIESFYTGSTTFSEFNFGDINIEPNVILSSASGLILNNIASKPRLNSSNIEYGLVKDNFILNEFYVNNNILVNGNLYILGNYQPNLSEYTTSYFNEVIFNLKSHTHDGVDSKQLSISDLTAENINNFNLVLSSGNITINNKFIGNDIGLEETWNEIDTNVPMSDMQQLISYKNKLYIANNSSVVNFYDDLDRIDVPYDNSIPIVISTNNGDKLALLNYIKGDVYGMTADSITDIKLTLKDNTISVKLPIIASVTERYAIEVDRCVRINSNVYCPFVEKDITGDLWLSLYQINTIKQTVKEVAYVKMSGGDDFVFYPSMKYKDSVIILYSTEDDNYFCAVYNTLIRPKRYTQIEESDVIYNEIFEKDTSERLGFNFFAQADSAYNNESPGLHHMGTLIGNYRILTNYFYTNGIYGSRNVEDNTNFISFNLNKTYRNRVLLELPKKFPKKFSYTDVLSNLINYASTVLGITKSDIDTNTIKKITGINEPWIVSPIIHQGYLYGIAPIMNFNNWSQDNIETVDYAFMVNNRLPSGSKLVRKRTKEIDLVDMNNYTV